jgi:hypothetical protein
VRGTGGILDVDYLGALPFAACLKPSDFNVKADPIELRIKEWLRDHGLLLLPCQI